MEVLFIKICNIQPLDLLFIFVFISFYINRYHFSKIFKTSFSIIWKKDFCNKFSFFNRVTETPHSLKRPKSAKNDKSFSSMLTHKGDFAQHSKSVTHHLFISYLRNLYIIIYIYKLFIYNFLSRISENLLRKFRLPISYSGNYLLISRVLLTVCTYILLLHPFKYIPNT